MNAVSYAEPEAGQYSGTVLVACKGKHRMQENV